MGGLELRGQYVPEVRTSEYGEPLMKVGRIRVHTERKGV